MLTRGWKRFFFYLRNITERQTMPLWINRHNGTIDKYTWEAMIEKSLEQKGYLLKKKPIHRLEFFFYYANCFEDNLIINRCVLLRENVSFTNWLWQWEGLDQCDEKETRSIPENILTTYRRCLVVHVLYWSFMVSQLVKHAWGKNLKVFYKPFFFFFCGTEAQKSPM